MHHIILRKRSCLAIARITEQTAEKWGNAKSTELTLIFQSALLTISESPLIGRRIKINNVFVLTLSKVPFVIVYQVTKDTVQIITVLHTKRNR